MDGWMVVVWSESGWSGVRVDDDGMGVVDDDDDDDGDDGGW